MSICRGELSDCPSNINGLSPEFPLLVRGMGWCRIWGSSYRSNFMGRDDDNIDASIEASAIFSGVVSDGVILGVACGGKSLGADALAGEQEANDLGCAGGRELPVRLKLCSVDGYIVGMTFNAKIACD